MEKKQIEDFISRLRKAYGNEQQFITKGLRLPWEKCDDYADKIEDSLDMYLDDFYETEKDIIDDVKETYPDGEDILDMMFDRDEDFNDEDDGIGGFLSRD